MIVVKDLSKRFQLAGREVVAVDQLSFSVQRGEVFGLLGPNGAGKTTTLRMIVGLLAPDSGYAELAGFRTSDAPDEVKSRIGLVSASDGIYPSLTVRELLAFFADLYGLDARTARERIANLSRLLQFRDYLDRRCSTLSTGQRQRVTLARAMVHSPNVMLMDEPTRGLDVIGSQVVLDYVQHARECGAAVVLSTHHLDEAQRLCDRFGLLDHGRLISAGTLGQLQAATSRMSLVEIFQDLIRMGHLCDTDAASNQR
jgi:ABC-2 type transport system ATP-binding protein/sodium transport system ATP-binding protein